MYDVLNHIIDVGNLKNKDLLNFCEVFNYRSEEIFKKALYKQYGLKGVNKDLSGELIRNVNGELSADVSNRDLIADPNRDLYEKMYKIFGDKFKKDKATILLIPHLNISNQDIELINLAMNNSYTNFKSFLRRGDLIELLNFSGSKCKGVYMFDGEKIINLNYQIDIFGSPSKKFVVFKDFPPDYWNYLNEYNISELNINDFYCPGLSSKFFWNDPSVPVLVDKNFLLQHIEKGKIGIKEHYYYEDVVDYIYYNYVIVEYGDKKYKVVIPDEFTEKEELYYKCYGGGFLEYVREC